MNLVNCMIRQIIFTFNHFTHEIKFITTFAHSVHPFCM